MVQSTQPFTQAFPIHGDEIRVVDLMPGSGLDAITLECRITTLSKCCNFEALSYVWGDPTSKSTVTISGYGVEITGTLHAALHHLRHSPNKRTLWADQICIDQDDDDEKSHQVSLMREIYTKCSQCVIWLGKIPGDKNFSTSDAKVALDFIQTTAYRPYLPWDDNDDIHPFFADDECGERARQAFEALFMGGNPWWSRVWTLQEAALPAAATLHWGPLTLPLETIELAAKHMCQGWQREIPSKKVEVEYQRLLNNLLYPVRGLSIGRDGEGALDTLMRWKYRRATNPRDKVFGIVGLLRPQILCSIPALRNIDYRISPTVLFARVTLDLIRTDDDLRPLVGARELPSVTPGLPTWAIDFASCSAIGPRQRKWWEHSHRYKWWTVSTGMSLRLEASKDDKTICLSGILVDRVIEVSEVYHVSEEAEINDKILRHTINRSYHMLKKYHASCGNDHDLDADYVGGGTLKDAFWRTLLGNLIMAETPVGSLENEDGLFFTCFVNEGEHSHLISSIHGFVPNHAFFITKGGYMGMGPSDIRKGDTVCIFGGGRVPFIIRSEESPNRGGLNSGGRRYQLVGDAYVHGIMSGEIVNLKKKELEIIELV